MTQRLDADAGHIEMIVPVLRDEEGAGLGCREPDGLRASLIGESTSGAHRACGSRSSSPVTSLCPCSKKISDYGAHNQRSHITHHGAHRRAHVDRGADRHRRAGSLVRAVRHPQAPRREVRDRARLRQSEIRRGHRARRRGAPERRERVRAYVVEAENFESIHNHSAYALIENDKDKPGHRSR